MITLIWLWILGFVAGYVMRPLFKKKCQYRIGKVKEAATQYTMEINGEKWFKNKPKAKRSVSKKPNAKKK